MQFREVISASLSTIDPLCKKVEHFLQDNEFEGDLFWVLLGIRELLTNAVIHGSKLDARKEVEIELQLNRQRLMVQVTDRGEGFQWREVVDRDLRGTHVLQEHGRGFFIIRQYFDELRINSKGNQVVIIKNL